MFPCLSLTFGRSVTLFRVSSYTVVVVIFVVRLRRGRRCLLCEIFAVYSFLLACSYVFGSSFCGRPRFYTYILIYLLYNFILFAIDMRCDAMCVPTAETSLTQSYMCGFFFILWCLCVAAYCCRYLSGRIYSICSCVHIKTSTIPFISSFLVIRCVLIIFEK